MRRAAAPRRGRRSRRRQRATPLACWWCLPPPSRAGGGWCYDAKTCAGRSPDLTSSKGWPATNTPAAGSLLASSDARLAAANLVYAPYCSSDGWAGSMPAAPPTNFAFRGHDIVE